MTPIKSVTLWDLQRIGIIDFNNFFEWGFDSYWQNLHPSLVNNSIRNNRNLWQIPFQEANQGIIAIHSKNAFFQLYFNHGKDSRFSDGLTLMKANAGQAFYDMNLPYGVKHGQECTYVIGEELSIDRIASKIVASLSEPLHNWGQDSTLVLYSGTHRVRDIADKLDGYVYSPHKNKPMFFKPRENYRLKQGEMPLIVSTVKL